MNYKRKALLLLMLIILCSILCAGFTSCGAEYHTVSVGSSLDDSQSSGEIKESSSISESESDFSNSDAEVGESDSQSSSEDYSDSVQESVSSSSSESSDNEKDGKDSSADSGSFEEEIEHKHNFYLLEKQEATCEQDGYALYECECSFTYREPLEALKHSVSTLPEIKGTCIHRGLTEGSYCSRCEKILVQQQETEYGAHNMTECVCAYCGLLELKFEFKLDYDEIGYTAPYYACSTPIGVDTSKVHRIVIPDTYKGYAVAYVEKDAFSKFYGLYTVEIGVNVVKIGKGAFMNCFNLVEVYDRSATQVSKWSNTENGYLTAYAKAVHHNAYTSNITQARDGFVTYKNGVEDILIGYDGEEENAIIPDGVTSINPCAFSANEKTKRITVSSTVTYVSALAFVECCNLEEIILKEPLGWTSSMQETDEWIPFTDDLSNSKTAYDAFVVKFKYYYWKRKG